MENDLWRWSAVAVAAAIRDRKVSSREVVSSNLARLDAVNPGLNAVVDVMADEALRAADAADKMVADGAMLGVLHGVPVTVKINVDFKGRATTNGVEAYKKNFAPDDSPVIANLRKAGAVFLGRTNTPAFSARWFTDNDAHGRTLNPWNAAITPGGSSGGAASAVAAGIGTIGHGNDQGGSIRYPAYACGVAGLRPSLGRVPAYNPSATSERPIVLQLSSVQGPLARSIADLRLGLSAMAARDWRDPWWTPVADASPEFAARRVALCTSVPGISAAPAVVRSLHQAARWLADVGYQVDEAEPPRLVEGTRLWTDLTMNEGRHHVLQAIEQFGDVGIRRANHGMDAAARDLDLPGFMAALAARSTLLREWMAFFERYPLLLLPVSWEVPFPIDLDQQGDATMRRLITAQSPLLTPAILGLPGLSVPTGLADGVPTGVQLVAGRFGESLCLRAAELIEERAGLTLPIDPR